DLRDEFGRDGAHVCVDRRYPARAHCDRHRARHGYRARHCRPDHCARLRSRARAGDAGGDPRLGGGAPALSRRAGGRTGQGGVSMSEPLLRVEDIHTYLGDSYVIQGVSLELPAGKVLAVLGRNGAGKTTTLRSIMRLVHPRRGRVTFDGRDISALSTVEVARSRIAFVQETRAIFPSLSVEENLAIAARPAPDGEGWTLQRLFDAFPVLAQRRRNGGMQLSGG